MLVVIVVLGTNEWAATSCNKSYKNDQCKRSVAQGRVTNYFYTYYGQFCGPRSCDYLPKLILQLTKQVVSCHPEVDQIINFFLSNAAVSQNMGLEIAATVQVL